MPGKAAKEVFKLSNSNALVYVYGSTIKLIFPHELATSQTIHSYCLTRSSGISDDNGYCLISRYQIIRFGVRSTTEVQAINLKTGTIKQLPPMHVGRFFSQESFVTPKT